LPRQSVHRRCDAISLSADGAAPCGADRLLAAANASELVEVIDTITHNKRRRKSSVIVAQQRGCKRSDADNCGFPQPPSAAQMGLAPRHCRIGAMLGSIPHSGPH
jgi:hypothetical protein